MQFQLHLNVDKPRVKAAALDKMWNAKDEPLTAENLYGEFVRNIRVALPSLSRERFYHEFGEAIDESFEWLAGELPRLNQETSRHMSTSKVLCLTELPDNTLLWAHYADSHRGAVLQFRSVDGLDSPWTEARPIDYVQRIPPLIDEEMLADLISGRATIDVQKVIRRIVYTKSSEWAYEREWRIHAGDGRTVSAPHEDIPFHEKELDALIFGCRMPQSQISELALLAKVRYPHIQLMRAEQLVDGFQLRIVPL